MPIKNEEATLIIESVLKTVGEALQKNKKKIIGAYEQMQEMGGLPIAFSIKLSGDLTEVKSVISFSFPLAKFKEVYEDTIELKQKPLDFKAGNKGAK